MVFPSSKFTYNRRRTWMERARRLLRKRKLRSSNCHLGSHLRSLFSTVRRPRKQDRYARGQVAAMQSSFTGLFAGLAFAVALVYPLLVVNFQSWTEAFIII